jgi:hypothetical protein
MEAVGADARLNGMAEYALNRPRPFRRIGILQTIERRIVDGGSRHNPFALGKYTKNDSAIWIPIPYISFRINIDQPRMAEEESAPRIRRILRFFCLKSLVGQSKIF